MQNLAELIEDMSVILNLFSGISACWGLRQVEALLLRERTAA